MTVAESALNVACAGARPVAVVDCLNLGNPEHPEVMWQLSEVVDGLAEACRALGLPVVGGNVSLYNESEGRDIDPTPVVGVVGLIDRLERRVPGLSLAPGERLVLLGHTVASLAGSRWAAERGSSAASGGGRLPPLDLAMHRALVELVVDLVGDGVVTGLHDVSDGGLGVALAELAVQSGTGLVARGIAGHAELFSESPSRGRRVHGGPRGDRSPGQVGRVGRARARHCRRRPARRRGPRRRRPGRPRARLAIDVARSCRRPCASAGPGGRRAASGSRGRGQGRRSARDVTVVSGTDRSPCPVPTVRSGLYVPW